MADAAKAKPIPASPPGSSPVQVVKPPLRALPIGNDASRAVQFSADQQRSRGQQNGYGATGSDRDHSRMSDSLGEAIGTQGGLESYSGPLASPVRKTQTYAAGAGDEVPEPADIYGAKEAEGRARMAEIHKGPADEEPVYGDRPSFDSEEDGRLPIESAPEREAEETGPSQKELANAVLFQLGTSAAKSEDEKKQQGIALESVQNAKAMAEKVKKARLAFSRIWDSFDAAHGVVDVIGLIKAFGSLNLRLLTAFFKKDLKLLPQAQYPYECGAIACFDLMVCLSMLMSIIAPIIVITAIIAAAGGATYGITEVFNIDISSLLDRL